MIFHFILQNFIWRVNRTKIISTNSRVFPTILLLFGVTVQTYYFKMINVPCHTKCA